MSELNGLECSPYKEGECFQVLKDYLSLCSSENQEVFIASSDNETAIHNAISLLKQNNSSDMCRVEILSLLCLHLFGLCVDDNTTLIQPTIRQCEHVRSRVCLDDWKIVSAAGINLPQCDNLSNNSNASCSLQNFTQQTSSKTNNLNFVTSYQIFLLSCQKSVQRIFILMEKI